MSENDQEDKGSSEEMATFGAWQQRQVGNAKASKTMLLIM